ncbi:hypothetical protein BHOIPH791_05860 [Bartonella henselae]|uniref:Uncharacterized protein n=1 Tax=Bartonella henselae TaxID=38323 RepID=X5M2Y1_BARHN|nr:hypothetical protein BhenCHDE101_00450 [Bartonella henselae]ETS09242.1 hypothetical protein Q654_00640 [Bartonella henselae JK 50]ETS09399.1 hypothetical protein Q655_00588 [Bartonella henselae JK 51]OLL39123.1 hypothetical protein AT237_01365 [Bartonella henselae]OLL42104.1 hypothetical protein AT244_03035 [Bartonella henselae]
MPFINHFNVRAVQHWELTNIIIVPVCYCVEMKMMMFNGLHYSIHGRMMLGANNRRKFADEQHIAEWYAGLRG